MENQLPQQIAQNNDIVRPNHPKKLSKKFLIILTAILLIGVFGVLIYKTLFISKVANIKRGDLISYVRNNQKFIGRVIGLPGEAVLDKEYFYVKSQGKIFRVTEYNLPHFDMPLATDAFIANEQKWFTIGKNEVYVIKDSYPQMRQYPDSPLLIYRTLDLPGGLVTSDEIKSVLQPKPGNLTFTAYQPAPQVTEKKPIIDKQPKVDLLYPPKIVKQNKITAVIKLNLVGESFISSQFLKIYPDNKFFHPNETTLNTVYYTYFTPSKTNDLTIALNGTKIDSHGFTTQPYVDCSAYFVDTLEKTGYINYSSEHECLGNKQVDLLVLANLELQQGSNSLEVLRGDTKTSVKYTIVYNPGYSIEPGFPLSPSVPVQDRFTITHRCSGLSDANGLSIPLVASKNPDIYYRLSFPQNRSERGSTSQRLVYFKIDGVLYDIVLPPTSVFNRSIPTVTDFEVPSDNLVFSDGTPAEPSKMLKTDNLPYADYVYPGIYFELVPFDASNKVYPSYILPWGTIGDSSCDG